VHPHLRERLGKAIVQRRRQFAYQQRHQKKMEVYGDSRLRHQPRNQPTRAGLATYTHSITGDNIPHQQQTLRPPAAEAMSAAAALSQTIASTFRPERLAIDGKSTVASESVGTSLGGDLLEELPPPPSADAAWHHVPCPYCHQLLVTCKLKKKWRYCQLQYSKIHLVSKALLTWLCLLGNTLSRI
jgi:hypothetical protein